MRAKVRLLAPPLDYDNDEAYDGPEVTSSTVPDDRSNQYGSIRRFNHGDGGDARSESARHAADLEAALNKAATMKSMNGSVAHVRDDIDDNYMMSGGLEQNQSSSSVGKGVPPPRPPRDDPSLFSGSTDASRSPTSPAQSQVPRARHSSAIEGPQAEMARKVAAEVARNTGTTSPVGSPTSGRRSDASPREPHTGPDYAVAGFARGLDHALVQRKVGPLNAWSCTHERSYTHAYTSTSTSTHLHMRARARARARPRTQAH